MNKTVIIGNLSRDPQLRTVNTSNGEMKVCDFDVAVNTKRGGKESVSYFRISAWRALGESCSKYLRKGKKVCVEGTISANAYIGNDGEAHAQLQLVAASVEFLSPAERSETTQPAEQQPTASANVPAFTEVETDELPF